MERSSQLMKYRVRPTQVAEAQLHAKGFASIAGVDEVGRGCLAGPLVAAAVILPPKLSLVGLADSKLLSPSARQRLFQTIIQTAVAWGIGMVSAAELDQSGMTAGTHTAFDRSLVQLYHRVDYILVDGRGFFFPHTPFSCVVNGDEQIAAIAAASVLAKVYRDHVMRFMDRLFPGYGFGQHKGYGTALHLRALTERGACTIHRRCFSPVAQVVGAAKV